MRGDLTVMPTMQDIAERVGVHRATVSNVLNGKLRAERSDAARRAAKIRRVAAEMGYRPNTAARATRTGRTGFIGMIHSPWPTYSVTDPAFAWGVDEALDVRGLCLVRDTLHVSSPDQPDPRPPRIVRENAVDGLLINYAFGLPASVRGLLEHCCIPAVWINRKRDRNCVRPNDAGAALEATRYLIEQGHRRIDLVRGLVAAPQVEPHYSILDRQAGYEQAMREAGLTPCVVDLPPSPAGYEERLGYLLRCYVQWLRQADRPSAVLCHVGGREMCHAAALVGLRVPDELSVMSFDDDAGADERVAVDRVLVRHRAVGRAAVGELCALIDEPNVPRPPVLVPFEFHRTGTVARPNCPS